MNASELQKQAYESPDYYTPAAMVDGERDHWARIACVRNLFAKLPPAKVLDVGCGCGIILGPLAKRHEIHGVDISEAAVAIANNAGLKARQHDLENPLPYADASFDIVFSGETIEHQVDTDIMLSEINRVLKPGGQLVLTYPNIRTLLGIFMLVFLDMPPMFAARYRAPHYRDFTLRTIKIALRNNGFQLNKATGCCFYLPRVGQCFPRLASFMPRLASMVMTRATKVADVQYRAADSLGDIF